MPDLTEAEMARAVAQGVKIAYDRAETRKTIGCLSLLLGVVLGILFSVLVGHLLPGNDFEKNGAFFIGLILPFVLFRKALA